MPPLEPRHNLAAFQGRYDPDSEDSESDSDGSMPSLRARYASDSSDDDSDDGSIPDILAGNHNETSSDEDDDDDDEPPELVSGNNSDSSDSDDDGGRARNLTGGGLFDRSSAFAQNLAQHLAQAHKSESDSDEDMSASEDRDYDSDSDDSGGSMPSLVDRGSLESDDSDSEDEVDSSEPESDEDDNNKFDVEDLKDHFRKVGKSTKKFKQEKLLKEQEQSVSIIAASYRSYAARRNLKKATIGITALQAIVRGYIHCHNFKIALKGFIALQAIVRGMIGRRHNIKTVQQIHLHRKEYRKFKKIWGRPLDLIKKVAHAEGGDWSTLKDKQAFIRQEEFIDDDELKETDKKLTDAMVDAIQDFNEMKIEDDEEFEVVPYDGSGRSNGKSTSAGSADTTRVLKQIHLSADVVKWLRTGDRKYRDFFIRRMKQLAQLETEERSRILGKRLMGSKHTIYETYLEQKSGYRILFTEKGDYLLVWYVAKHKNVSRLMKLIDDSKNRSQRQRVAVSAEIEELKHLKANSDSGEEKQVHEIFLDPLGNVPLKVYNIETNDIDEILEENWTPVLHLTEEERDVVETKGSVLLLGRSGTGKTVCICNRMEYDRQTSGKRSRGFSQLFVARSPRLCRYVEKNIGSARGSQFTTFNVVVDELERVLPKVDGVRDDFPDGQQMTFSKFRQEIYDGSKDMDALLVWTNIRSFLKGSMEALKNNPNFFVTEDDYLSFKNFGKKRCRFSMEQRRFIYNVFLKYQDVMKQHGYWDNCDRIISLILRLCSAKLAHTDMFQGDTWCAWSKIYVDEVQDYTQAECLLFFHLCDAGDLFLAGDPAQNVVRGVEFRFEDIRSVGYYIAGDRRDLIPDKPKIVNINFRSHAGILGCAASILSQMFAYFPDSAKELGKDDGLFQGPRPGVFHMAKPEIIGNLVSEKMNGAVILTHDEIVGKCQKRLGGYGLVYGIRAAKGLEFKTVIVLDFFSSLPTELQKPWREMLLGRADHKFNLNYPEVEGQLKLLYTAVTRCIDRLFFAETSSCISGDAFVRWMTTNTLKRPDGSVRERAIATSNNITDIENMTMTQDEWLASGISNAEAAEAEENIDEATAESLLDKAIYCFEQAKHGEFARKAKVHLESLQFRRKILRDRRSGLDSQNRMASEAEGAKIMEKLLRENLLLEARGLGKDIQYPTENIYSYSKFVQHHIVEKLPA